MRSSCIAGTSDTDFSSLLRVSSRLDLTAAMAALTAVISASFALTRSEASFLRSSPALTFAAISWYSRTSSLLFVKSLIAFTIFFSSWIGIVVCPSVRSTRAISDSTRVDGVKPSRVLARVVVVCLLAPPCRARRSIALSSSRIALRSSCAL